VVPDNSDCSFFRGRITDNTLGAGKPYLREVSMRSVFMGSDAEIKAGYVVLRDYMIAHYIRQYRRKKLTKKELAVIRKYLYTAVIQKNKFGCGMWHSVYL
jgi:hypothetical protein